MSRILPPDISPTMVRRISLICLAGSVLLASACEKAAPPPQYRIVTLPSGKQVKTLGVGQINFPQSGPALMLRYISDVPMSDTLALGREATKSGRGSASTWRTRG